MDNKNEVLRIYNANEVCSFRKTNELYGGLSNMASGYPIFINGTKILTSEALYQACRFPALPEVQQKIIDQKSPMAAKMVGKPFRERTRGDWDSTRVAIMRWTLRVKLAQNYLTFGQILLSTENRPIVEESHKDDFWGAIRDKNNYELFKGTNALGRLLMELRESYRNNNALENNLKVYPLQIPNFLLLDRKIDTIDESDKYQWNSSELKFELKNVIEKKDETLKEKGRDGNQTSLLF